MNLVHAFRASIVGMVIAAASCSGQVVTSFQSGNLDLQVYDVANRRYATPIAANSIGFRGLTADNVGRVLYASNGLVLYRIPFDPPQTPVAVGSFSGAVTIVSGGLAWDSLRGELYGTAAEGQILSKLVRINPATAATTLVRAIGAGDFAGIDYEPLTDRIFATNDSTSSLNGLAGRGLYVFIPPYGTGPIVKIAEYPAGEIDIDGCAAGGGKVYLVEDEARWMHVYNVATGVFEQPINQIPVGIDRVTCGGAWAEGLLVAAPTADLGVVLVDSPDPLGVVGAQVEYTATIENFGPSASGPMALTFEFPPSAVFVSSVPAGTLNGNVLSVPLSGIGVGDVTIARATIQGLAFGDHLCSVALSGTVEDPDPSNNTATQVTTVRNEADLSLGGAGPALCTVGTGENFYVTFELANNGPGTAMGAEFRCDIPVGSSFWFSDPGGFPVAGELLLDLGTMFSGQSQVVTVGLLAETGGVHLLNATVTSNLADPTPATIELLYRIRGGCAADFDASGSPDSDDIIAFFADWDSGENCADVDGSGGVDSDDIVLFFGQWDAGGC